MKYSRILVLATLIAGLGIVRGAAQDSGDVFTKFDKNPVPMLTPPPQFPSNMRGVTGLVSITVIIDEQGLVASANVQKSTHPEFEAPALEAIKRWKFTPAEKDGQRVKAKVALPMRFNGGA